MATHNPDELARFQKGESRMVWAVHVDDPEQRVFFPEVTPEERRPAFREFTRKSLCCIVPECRVSLTAHFREAKRDGFAHPKGTKSHGPESLWHHEAKARIAEWAAAEYPGMHVQLEQATDDRKRRPDVTITGATGHQVAIEIQYAALSVEQWRERQRDLARDGRSVVWLLGHAGDHFKLDRACRIKYSELVRVMAAEGCIPLWFNPIEDLILTTWSKPDEHGITPPAGRFAYGYKATPLGECRLTRGGVLTEYLEQLRAATETRVAAHARALELEERRRRETEARLERQLLERRRLLEVRRDRWTRSELYTRLTAAGALPDILTVPPTVEDVALADALDLHPSHWKAAVYDTILAGKGASVSNSDVLSALTRTARGRRLPNYDALNLFLASLVDAALIRAEVENGPRGRRVFEAVRLEPAPPEPAGEAALPAAEQPAEEPGDQVDDLEQATRATTELQAKTRSPLAVSVALPPPAGTSRKPGAWRRLLGFLGFIPE